MNISSSTWISLRISHHLLWWLSSTSTMNISSWICHHLHNRNWKKVFIQFRVLEIQMTEVPLFLGTRSSSFSWADACVGVLQGVLLCVMLVAPSADLCGVNQVLKNGFCYIVDIDDTVKYVSTDILLSSDKNTFLLILIWISYNNSGVNCSWLMYPANLSFWHVATHVAAFCILLQTWIL